MESREVEEIKRHFDVIAESLRSDIKVVADGLSVLNGKIDNLHEELNVLREENSKEHKAMIEWAGKEHQKMREENQREHKAMMDRNEKVHQSLREDNERQHKKMMEQNVGEHKAMMEQNRKEHREILSKIELFYGDLHHRVSALEEK